MLKSLVWSGPAKASATNAGVAQAAQGRAQFSALSPGISTWHSRLVWGVKTIMAIQKRVFRGLIILIYHAIVSSDDNYFP